MKMRAVSCLGLMWTVASCGDIGGVVENGPPNIAMPRFNNAPASTLDVWGPTHIYFPQSKRIDCVAKDAGGNKTNGPSGSAAATATSLDTTVVKLYQSNGIPETGHSAFMFTATNNTDAYRTTYVKCQWLGKTDSAAVSTGSVPRVNGAIYGATGAFYGETIAQPSFVAVYDQRILQVNSYTFRFLSSASGGTKMQLVPGNNQIMFAAGIGVDTVSFSLCAQPFASEWPTYSPCKTLTQIVTVALGAPPVTPTIVDGFVHLAWPAQPTATGYKIYRRCVDPSYYDSGWGLASEDGLDGASITIYDEVSSYLGVVENMNPPYFAYKVVTLDANGAEIAVTPYTHYFRAANTDPMGC